MIKTWFFLLIDVARKRLKREIGRQKERIAELQEELQHADSQQPERHSDDFFDLDIGVQNVIDLGERMVDHGRVPDLEYSSSSSPRTRTDTNPHYSDPVVTEIQRTSPPSSRRLRRTQSPIRTQPVQLTESRASPVIPPQVIIHPPDDEQETWSSRSEESDFVEVNQPPAKTTNWDLGEGPSTLTIEESPESSISTRAYAEGDFISVQKTSSHIRYNPAIPRESITGSIVTNNNAVKIAAFIDRNLAENIIPLTLVTELGLKVFDSDEDKDWKWIHIGDAPGKRSRGRVLLSWNHWVSPRLTPLKVHCWVYEDDGSRHLVFGKAFLKKRTYYWAGTDEVEEG